jgi:hypothetical protein
MLSPRVAIRGTSGLTLDELEDLYRRIDRARDDLAGVLGATEKTPLGLGFDRQLAELYAAIVARARLGAHL